MGPACGSGATVFLLKMVQIILNFGGNFEKMMIFMIFGHFFRILDVMMA